MSTELDAFWAFLLACLVALVATPFAGRLARRLGAIDEPKERSLHDLPTPRLGGLAIFLGVLAAAIAWLPADSQTKSILLAAAAITAVGMLDDIFDIHPALKLGGQIAAALLLAKGLKVENVTVPFLGALEFGWLAWPLTVAGVVAVMNVVNFTDGVDGLAAGVCTISAVTFAIIALSLDRNEAGVLAALTAGAALGFLYHNFHPASVFMGDTGSNLLGLLLATVAIQGVLKTAAVVALVFPLLILAVPILDSSFVIAKRIKHGQPVYQADRWHFHHRFANIGFSQRKTVLYLYLWTLTLAGLALAIRFVPYSDDSGRLDPAWSALLVAVGLVVLAASVYLVAILEILKFKRWRRPQLLGERVGQEGPPDEQAVDAQIAYEIETGEFPAAPGR